MAKLLRPPKLTINLLRTQMIMPMLLHVLVRITRLHQASAAHSASPLAKDLLQHAWALVLIMTFRRKRQGLIFQGAQRGRCNEERRERALRPHCCQWAQLQMHTSN